MSIKIKYFLLTSLLISSCAVNNLKINSDKSKENYELRVDDGSISKIINIKFNSLFSIKNVSSGQLEKTFSNLHHVKLIISKNLSAPFNEMTSSIDIPQSSISASTFSFTLNGLKSNTNYYIAARAYSSSTENESTNITEDGTLVSNEYISVNNNGNLSIINDNGNNKIDINIKFKNRIGARIDTSTKIREGRLGYFSISNMIAYKPPSGNNVDKPKVSINNKGNGLMLWHESNSSGHFVKGIQLKDYEVNSDPLFFSDNPPVNSVFNINDISFETDNDGNGVLIWSRKLDAVNPEHIFYKEIRNNLPLNTSETRLDSSSDSDILSKPILKLSHDNNKVVSAWLTGNSSTISEYTLRSSNLNPSISWGSQLMSNYQLSLSKVTSFDISKLDSNGNFLMILVNVDSSNNSKVQILKFSVDNFLNITNTMSMDITNYNNNLKYDAKVYLNDKGDGLIAWIEQKTTPTNSYSIFCKRIFNFFPSNELIELASSTNIKNNLSLSLNNQGDGVVSWIEDTSIILEKLNNFYPSYENADISLSTPQDLTSFLNVKNKGLFVFKDGTDLFYGRIFNNIPQ
jgi:hypothetical protein